MPLHPMQATKERPMPISEVIIQLLDFGPNFRWAGLRPVPVKPVFLRLRTDDGMEGYALSGTGDLPPEAVASALASTARPKLLGADPFERPQLIKPLLRGARVGTPLAAVGMVDVALWDLAGKAAGVPIYQLMGGYRQRVKACASAPPCPEEAACETMLFEIIEQGFRAIKLHVSGDLARDIATCRLARRVVGDDVELMMDAMGLYNRQQALALGQVLDYLHFRWFEDPLPDSDLPGWVALGEALTTQVAGVDSVRFTPADYAHAMAAGAYDVVRLDGARHGITWLKQLATMAEAFGLTCEGHSFGLALAQAANFQVALSVRNSAYCELPVPLGNLDVGVRQGLRLDRDGYVMAPDGPGLGLEVDLDAIRRAVIATL